MTLVELVQRVPEDFAARPVAGPRNSPNNLPTFDPAYSKVVGTFDAIDIWGSREKNGYDAFGIRDGATVAAYVIISERYVRPDTRQLHEIWVSEPYERRGYASALLLFILKKLNVKLFCAHDDIVSGDARELLKKLETRKKIKLSNATTKEPVSGTELDDHTKNDLELIVESDKSKWPMFANEKSTLVEQVSVVDQHGEYI